MTVPGLVDFLFRGLSVSTSATAPHCGRSACFSPPRNRSSPSTQGGGRIERVGGEWPLGAAHEEARPAVRAPSLAACELLGGFGGRAREDAGNDRVHGGEASCRRAGLLEPLAVADLIVVAAPTHNLGLPSAASREKASRGEHLYPSARAPVPLDERTCASEEPLPADGRHLVPAHDRHPGQRDGDEQQDRRPPAGSRRHGREPADHLFGTDQSASTPSGDGIDRSISLACVFSLTVARLGGPGLSSRSLPTPVLDAVQ